MSRTKDQSKQQRPRPKGPSPIGALLRDHRTHLGLLAGAMLAGMAGATTWRSSQPC